MKKIDANFLMLISGAAGSNPNQQLANNMTNNVAWGMGIGAVTSGIPGAIFGGTGAAVQTVVQGAYNHGPVNVPIPHVPMGPSWIFGPEPLDWMNQNVPK